MGTLLQMEHPGEPDRRELAGIVHDFNNLLGVALNFSILAREKLAAGDSPAGDQVQQALKYLERIENAARGAIQLNKELAAQIPPRERPHQP
jgi:hypothetical protein